MDSVFIEDIPVGYAYCKVIFNEFQRPVNFKYIACNSEFEKILGKNKSEIIGKKSGDIFDCKENVFKVMEAGIKVEVFGLDISLDYHDVKNNRWYKLAYRKANEGNLSIYFVDISCSVNVDRVLDLENRRLREVVEGTQTGIWEWNMVDGINIVNENWAEIIGYTADELNPITHNQWRGMINEEDINKSDELIQKHINGETDYYITEFRIRHKTGDWIWVLERGKIVSYTQDGKPEMMIGTHIDITDRKQKQEEIAYLSYHDQLTGVYNRRYFEETIKDIDIEENLPISLVVTDVNGLKLTNDAFGHQVGDNLIVRAADILKSNSREVDVVARIGGDEFVVVLPKTNDSIVNRVAERYYEMASKSELDPVSVSMAIGFATKYRKDENIMDTFREAEQSMYDRKIKESKSVKEDNLESIIESFFKSRGIEKKHSESVSKLSEDIGSALGMSKSDLEHLTRSSLLHDIGSIGVGKNTFGDLSGLTEYEKREMRRHPEVGYQILKSVNHMVPIAEYVLHHHERWDGKGYPSGLKREQIPLHSRIISIVDSYDMLVNVDKKSKQEAMSEIEKHAGTRFDPKVVTIFLNKANKYEV